MSEESSEDLTKKIAFLEQQLAAMTAERNLLHEQLSQAQDATLAAERRAAAAETELKIVQQQNLISDGKVSVASDPSTPQTQAPQASSSESLPSSAPTSLDPETQPQSPPDTTAKGEKLAESPTHMETPEERESSRLAKIWHWLWEENNRAE